MIRAARAVLAAAAVSAASAAAGAAGWVEGADDAGEMRVAARIVVHPDSQRDELLAGVQFRLDSGWHLYWQNPGDTGLPTRIAWHDAEASEIDWPAPRAFEEADGELVTFGYAGGVLLTSRLRPALGARSLSATADVLVCRTSCIPASLALEAPLAPPAKAAERAALRALFAAQQATLPVAANSFGVSITALPSQDPREARLRISPCPGEGACAAIAPPASGPAFFSRASADPSVRALETRSVGGAIEMILRSDADAFAPRVRGVVALRDAAGAPRHLDVDVGLAAGAPLPRTSPALGLLPVLVLALLGGLVLNLMPCVLPVLALKVFAIGELAGRSRREALAHGAAYGVGIELSMLALAGVALALRGAGHAVGWGFQFQEPAYVAVISAVLVGFALNLFGVFEIGFAPSALADVGASATGRRRSFFEGLLAVALATPCSAPFLGTAIGFAFASPAAVIVAVFLAIGAGLALPFAALSAFPRFARFLPRSGAWMGQLRSGLGFALLATVVWLLWILGRSAGADAVVALLAVLLAGAFVAWAYGRLQHAGVPGLSLGAALAIGVLLVGAVNWVRVNASEPAAAAEATGGVIPWSPAALETALGTARPVFVYFTADWCLTCKLNERTALHTQDVEAELARGGFRVLRGDWTQRDEAIHRELARHRKAGVPLYLVYAPGAEQPTVLPELLTSRRLVAALRAAAR